jgi:hypothetical protein
LIVISGALAVVAFVLLIAGLVADNLGLVYASIAVSLVSAVFLGVGAFQRRGEEVARPGAEPAPSTGFGMEPVHLGASSGDAPAEEATVRIASGGAAASGGTVYVVPGRPRYHVEGCRYLAGKDGEPRSLAEARNEGYTACGICRPDENIRPTPELAFIGGAADDDDVDADEEFEASKPAHTEPRRTAAQRRTAAAGTARRATGRKTAAKKTAAKKSTAKRATVKKTTAKKTTAKKSAARSTPTKTAAKKTAARSTAKKATAKRTPAKKSAARGAAKKTTAKKSAKKAAKRSSRR